MQFIDLKAQYAAMKAQIDDAIHTVLQHGQFIMGPEVRTLENALCQFSGAQNCITCGSGTDAILMALMALDVKPGDAVFLPSFTFIATAEPVCLLGATPVFVDIDPVTYNISADSLEHALIFAQKQNLRPHTVIAVDMHGCPADYDAVRKIATANGMKIIADAAQSFGASHPSGFVGTLGDITCTSFFPGKPFGCYGDGGAVFTDDPALTDMLRSIRVHGKGDNKYDNVRIGLNSRLDTIQAAVLSVKLSHFRSELAARKANADKYAANLPPALTLPPLPSGYTSTYAYYSLLTEIPEKRDALLAAFSAENIPSGIYYPKPMHLQAAFSNYDAFTPDGCPVSADIAARTVSIPMHPYLSDGEIDQVCATCRKAV